MFSCGYAGVLPVTHMSRVRRNPLPPPPSSFPFLSFHPCPFLPSLPSRAPRANPPSPVTP
eukprot:1934259-Rhodomonas_salina.1